MGVAPVIKNLIRDPKGALEHFCSHHLPGVAGDRMYLKRAYKKRFGRRLNLRKPKLFTEKMQWLKLYDRNPLYTRLADKYEVREYIAGIAGGDYLIPLIGLWDSFEEINTADLPEQFVLKCTHDSGGLIICTDKKEFDAVAAKAFFKRRLEDNIYWVNREFCYKNIKPRIICEEYKVDESGVELKDYKVYCFNGIPKYILVIFNRFNGLRKNVYDAGWEFIPVALTDPFDDTVTFDRPAAFDEMLCVASKLAKDIPFVRVDFYIADKRLYVGELTFYPNGGHTRFKPPEYDAIFGACLTLPGKRRLS